MTIDERIEALTQSLELVVRDQEAQRQWIESLRKQAEAHDSRMSEMNRRQQLLADNMLVQGELMARLDRHIDDFVVRVDGWIETGRTQIAELQVLTRAAHERLDRIG
jgi:dsDNA-specific endonuclease/ATPase MutS2